MHVSSAGYNRDTSGVWVWVWVWVWVYLFVCLFCVYVLCMPCVLCAVCCVLCLVLTPAPPPSLLGIPFAVNTDHGENGRLLLLPANATGIYHGTWRSPDSATQVCVCAVFTCVVCCVLCAVCCVLCAVCCVLYTYPPPAPLWKNAGWAGGSTEFTHANQYRPPPRCRCLRRYGH